jgi:hypothetical protein
MNKEPTMDFESPEAYRARVASNAAKSNAPKPVQDTSSIPDPRNTFTPLPTMVNVPKSIDPGLAQLGRIAQSVANEAADRSGNYGSLSSPDVGSVNIGGAAVQITNIPLAGQASFRR